MNRSAFHDRARRRAVVTGGLGFIGSHLVDRLVGEAIQVMVIDDLSTGRLENVNPQARLERLDVASADLDGLFRRWRPDLVFHLAAQASVPLSVRDPLHDLEVNVVGTHRVATAAHAAGVDRFVFVSSGGAVYGDRRAPAKESTVPAPGSYYGVHKLAAEGHVVLAGMNYAIARPSNVYGPRQTGGLEGAVVAAFLDQARAEGVLRIHGDGAQTRDFIYVLDVVSALWLLADPDSPVGIWNVASSRATSISDLALNVERALMRPLGRVYGPPRPGDVRHSLMSAARLRSLGWRPRVSLQAGLRELAEASAHPSVGNSRMQ